MKRSIVLLISLFFIAAVSLLIMKNLEDTDLYLSEQNSKFSKTQIMFLLDNTREQIESKLKTIGGNTELSEDKQREVLKDYVGVNFPILIEDARIVMRLEENDKCDINLLKNDKNEENFKKFLSDKNIYIDITKLKEIYDNRTIDNSKKFDSILEKFEKESYKSDIIKIKDYISFYSDSNKEQCLTKNNKEKTINLYELFVEVEYLKQFAKAYYILDKSGGVKYFEYSFK